MDKPRHPHVIRTWVTGRNKHPFPAVPAPHFQPQRRSAIPAAPKPAKPLAPEPHKEPEE